MSQLISARVSDSTAERLRQYARRKQRTVNETFAVAVEEWLRQNEFANIEFRDTADGRLAFMKGSRLPVWWVIKIAQSYGMDVQKTLAHWNGERDANFVRSALNYYAAFPSEIDSRIEDFQNTTPDALRGRFPALEIIEIAHKE